MLYYPRVTADPVRNPELDGRRGAAQAAQRRESILAAALGCLTEQGYEPTTVAEIVARSGASTGSLYHFFPHGKPAIATAVHLDAQARYQRDLLPVLEAASAEVGIRGAVAFHLRWVQQNAPHARFLFADHPREVQRLVAPELAELNGEFFGQVRAWVQRHVAAGELVALPLPTFIAVWVGPAHYLARQRLLDGTLSSLERAAPALADAAWRSVAARTS